MVCTETYGLDMPSSWNLSTTRARPMQYSYNAYVFYTHIYLSIPAFPPTHLPTFAYIIIYVLDRDEGWIVFYSAYVLEAKVCARCLAAQIFFSLSLNLPSLEGWLRLAAVVGRSDKMLVPP